MAAAFDVFLSHTWREGDLEGARRLRDALRSVGLTVWFDEDNVRQHEGLSPAVVAGLASSKVLVAWFSTAYAQSRACGWELAAAYLAAQQLDAPQRRVMVVNPERGKDHIHPVDLRDALYSGITVSSESQALAATAEAIAAAVALVDSVLGDARPTGPARWVGRTRPSSPRFVGRRPELMRLHTALTAQEFPMTVDVQGPPVAQLLGFGGTGKTLLAARYGEQFGAAYPGGVYWLRATRDVAVEQSTEDAVRQALLTIAPAPLAVQDLRELSIEQLREEVGRALDAEGERFLWIVDDLPRTSTLDELQLWSAPGAFGATLVTSLRGTPWARGSAEQQLSLDRLDPQDAARLLTWDHAPSSDDERLAGRDLVAALGFHPLAIDVTRAALQARGGLQSCRDYLQALASPTRDEIEAAATLVEADELPTEHVTSIAATILRSAAGLSEPARDVLRLASTLAPAPIPQALITGVLTRTGDLEAAAGLDHAAKALADLQSRALATVHRVEGAAAQWEVHTLVRRLTARSQPDAGRRDKLRVTSMDVLADLLADFHEPGGIAATDTTPDHARHLTSELSVDDHRLALALAQDDYLRGNFRSAGDLQERALAARVGVVGTCHPETLTIAANLANSLWAMGEHKGARDLLEKVVAASERTVGPEHGDTLAAKGNLAGTLLAMGEYPGARDLQQQVLAASERALGVEHSTSLTTKGNLAHTLWAMGDHRKAMSLQRQVLEIRERKLGLEHRATLSTKGNLANSLWAMGEHASARELQRQVLEARERTLGSEHRSTLATKSNLAATLGAMGDNQGARDLEVQVLEARELTLGSEHPDTLTARGNLAGTLGRMGDHHGAHDLQLQVLADSERTLGHEHPSTLTIKANLGATLWHLGEYQRARELAEQVLDVTERTLGPEHPSTLTTRSNLASALRAVGEHRAAYDLFAQALEVSLRVLGPEHPSALTTKGNLALSLWDLGECQPARDLLEQVLEASERTLGREHPTTGITRANLEAMGGR